MTFGARPGSKVAATFPEPNPRRLARFATLAGRIGLAPPLLLLAFLAPLPRGPQGNIAGLPSLCLFHNLTGRPCLGCGMTRALVSLAHGHFADAVTYHPLSPFVFVLLMGLTIQRAAALLRPGRRFAPAPPPRLTSALAWAGIAALVLVWIARLAGALPAPP